MTILLVCLLAVLFFALIFSALRRKGYVRAALKGPLSSFSVEFEADDRGRDPKK